MSGHFSLNNIYSQKNTYVNTTQMVQDLTVCITLIYKPSPVMYKPSPEVTGVVICMKFMERAFGRFQKF